jgi:hypothetical protein
VLREGNQGDECKRCSEFSRTILTTMEELKSTNLIIKMLHDEINQLNTSSYINSNEPSNNIESSVEYSRKCKHLWKICKFTPCPSDNNISISNKYEALSETSDVSVGQAKIPVAVGGVRSQVNTTYKHPVGVSGFKAKNRNSSHRTKRNTDGAKPDVKNQQQESVTYEDWISSIPTIVNLSCSHHQT